MGQSLDNTMPTRMIYDENSENGLIICDKYLPEELLAEIFRYVDCKSLLKCQLVCKRWKILIQTYTWRKKAETLYGRSLLFNNEVLWRTYYLICKKKPFERNLIKNHSGINGTKHWRILHKGGDGWEVENPPIGVAPLPDDESVFEEGQSCFVTSFQNCNKNQIVDLETEGLDSYILDNIQPSIVASEWYSCRWDCPAIYRCKVTLLKADNKIIESFQFHNDIEGEEQYKWHYLSHEFKDYGPGLRKIVFEHGGVDKSFWKGYYGSKMAGASIVVKVPSPVKVSEISKENDIDY